ncbi:MAG: endonuclease domain-containing protein [Rhizomicrobium sp.]
MASPPINRRICKTPFAESSTSPSRGGRNREAISGGGYAPSLTPVERARHLRQHATPAERKLWRALRLLRSQGYNFRRQAPFDNYVADFVCHRASLIVELDGSQHGDAGQAAHDGRRTAFLNGRGYLVLRFWNRDVLRNCDGVVEAILRAARAPPEKSPRSAR